MFWSVAIRSGISLSAPVREHQTCMSTTDGFVLPYSIFGTLVWCHPARRASSLPLSPADWRSPRRRSPRASRACCTELVTGQSSPSVFVERNRRLPQRFFHAPAISCNTRVDGYCRSSGLTVIIYQIETYLCVIEQPPVIRRNFPGKMTRQISNIFASVYIAGRYGKQPALIIAVRHSDHSNPRNPHPTANGFLDQLRPRPLAVLGHRWFTAQKPAQRFGLARHGVGVSHFQVECFPLGLPEEFSPRTRLLQ
ncbi:hypothetical protein NG2371_01569 [Nocardia gamkensis]|nr:hypothetical protein [Nocardia gamkensis]